MLKTVIPTLRNKAGVILCRAYSSPHNTSYIKGTIYFQYKGASLFLIGNKSPVHTSRKQINRTSNVNLKCQKASDNQTIIRVLDTLRNWSAQAIKCNEQCHSHFQEWKEEGPT